MSRGGFKIIRNNWDYEKSERVDWIESFARSIEEAAKKAPVNAVEVARSRTNNSLIDQINSVFKQNAKINPVESKVQEYQDKTGIKEYLRRMNASKKDEQKKTAEDQVTGLPKSFHRLPEKVQEDIQNFIRNKCETHHGNIQVPALVEDVSKTFRNSGVRPQDVNDMEFEKFISDAIVQSKKQNPSTDEHNVNIGLGVGIDDKNMDSGNSDAFEGLTPVKSASKYGNR